MENCVFVIKEFKSNFFYVLKNWFASWKIMCKHPYLFIPDIVFSLGFLLLTYLLSRYIGVTDIFFLGADSFSKEYYLSFIKSNWFNLLYSIGTFIVLTFTFGISVFAYKYFLITNILNGKTNKPFFRQLTHAESFIPSLIILRVYTYLIFLVSIIIFIVLFSGLYKIFPSLSINWAIIILTCFFLLFLLFTLFSTPALFIDKFKAFKSLVRAYHFVMKKFIYSSFVLIFIIATFIFISILCYAITLPFNLPIWFSAIYPFIPVWIFGVFRPIFTFYSFKQ